MNRPFNRRILTAAALIAGAAMLEGCAYNPYTGTYDPCCAYPAYGYGYGYPAYNGYAYPAYAYGGGGYSSAVVVGGGGYYRGGWDAYHGTWDGGHGGSGGSH